MVVTSGFVGFEITWRAAIYDGAPQSSSANNYGTLGITFRAHKPASPDEWAEALLALTCYVSGQTSEITA